MKMENFFGYEAYTFGNEELEVCVITLGATVYSLKYKGRETVLNYADAQSYLDSTAFVNAAIGRYANRIGNSRFTLNGKEYILPANEGVNQLHGGPLSYDKRKWTAEVLSENSLRMYIFSPDGDNGFPGNLTAGVTYTVEGSSFRMDFDGVCDEDTVYAPTSHLYFNLDGGNVLEHDMWINSGAHLEVDAGLIPTGTLLPATGDFDFSAMRKVGCNFDDCFVLNGEHACTVEAGSIRMDLYTDFPAMQLYTGSALPAPHSVNEGLAIEPEFYPDSPNQPHFPSTTLRAGEKFHGWASFKFSDK